MSSVMLLADRLDHGVDEDRRRLSAFRLGPRFGCRVAVPPGLVLPPARGRAARGRARVAAARAPGVPRARLRWRRPAFPPCPRSGARSRATAGSANRLCAAAQHGMAHARDLENCHALYMACAGPAVNRFAPGSFGGTRCAPSRPGESDVIEIVIWTCTRRGTGGRASFWLCCAAVAHSFQRP